MLARLLEKYAHDASAIDSASQRHDKHVDQATAAMAKVKISGLDPEDGKGSGKGGTWIKKDYEAACKKAGLDAKGSVAALKARLGL